MNFVKSSQAYHSTDGSHAQEQQPHSGFNHNRQGFGGGGGYNGPGSMQQNLRGSRGGGFNRPRFNGPGNFSQGFGGQQFGGARGGGGGQFRFGQGQRFGGNDSQFSRSSSAAASRPSASRYSGFVKPQNADDQFEGGDGSEVPPSAPSVSRPFSAPSARHPYSGPRFQGNSGPRMSGRSTASGEGGGPIRAGFGRGLRSGEGVKRGGSSSLSANDNFSSVEAATAAAARATRVAANPNAKCVVLASTNMHLTKFKRLAEEIKKLKSKRPNAIDTIHSAANIAHVSIQSEIESGPIVRGTGTFFCLVQFDGINVSVATGLNKRASKVEAFEVALQKLKKPYNRIVEIDGAAKEFQAADYDFAAETPRQTVVKPTSNVVSDISGEGGGESIKCFQKESNVEALVDIKKRNYVAKELSDFVLVEPQEHNSSVNGASILRRSADFSKMLLEYDFAAFGSGGAVRCVLKLEGQTLADVIAHSKVASKIEASQKAVDRLREQCWTILTKQHHDSNGPEISKDELFDDLASCFTAPSSSAASMSTPIADGNRGKKLLEKMGWTGGGIGKDGAGIEEPVTMKQVINREGLGLDAQRGITADFRARVTEILENYAASERQDDLVFSPHFRKDERIIIHNECRRLNLKSKSTGQGSMRYLVIRRKRSAYQLLEHITRCGGETARYKIVPPGERKYPWRSTVPTTATAATASAGAKTQGSSVSSKVTWSSSAGNNKPASLMSPPALIQNLAAGIVAQMGANMMGPNMAMMGQNPGMLGQNMGMMGQNPGMLGQNPGLMGQNPGLMGQNPGMLGQNPGMMMGSRGGMGMARPNSAGVMGQNRGFQGHN